MAERRATNKYYPPEWTPDKGSINTFVGQHPLRERARKLHEGILIIRFELPFSVWCSGCHQHIAKGVRFNAEKKKAGKYFTTTIWNFRLKCHLCGNHFEIETDPKNHDYIVKIGAEKKTETWDESDNGTFSVLDEDKAQRLAEDPFFRLEHSNEDKEKANEAAPQLEKLLDFKDSRKDDYSLSSTLRSNFRRQKKEVEKMHSDGRAVGLDIPLLPPSISDTEVANHIKFGGSLSENHRKRRIEVKASSIFNNNQKGYGRPSQDNDALKKVKIDMLSKGNNLFSFQPKREESKATTTGSISFRPKIIPVKKTTSS